MAASQGLNGGVQLFSHPGSGGAAKSMRSIGLPLVVRLPVSPMEAATQLHAKPAMRFQNLWPTLLILFTLLSCVTRGSATLTGTNWRTGVRETKLWTSPTHASHFAGLQQYARTCESTRGPEALATPDPLIADPGATTISFIIGIDGRVYSPLVLESADPANDQPVIAAVRSWRYRPATCNGVPSESEAKVEFFSR